MEGGSRRVTRGGWLAGGDGRRVAGDARALRRSRHMRPSLTDPSTPHIPFVGGCLGQSWRPCDTMGRLRRVVSWLAATMVAQKASMLAHGDVEWRVGWRATRASEVGASRAGGLAPNAGEISNGRRCWLVRIMGL